MSRHQLTFKESCSRECALKLVACGGPTASGLEGYVCENCASFLVAEFERGVGFSDQKCNYCGGQPTHQTIGQFHVCRACAIKALQAAKAWYARQ